MQNTSSQSTEFCFFFNTGTRSVIDSKTSYWDSCQTFSHTFWYKQSLPCTLPTMGPFLTFTNLAIGHCKGKVWKGRCLVWYISAQSYIRWNSVAPQSPSGCSVGFWGCSVMTLIILLILFPLPHSALISYWDLSVLLQSFQLTHIFKSVDQRIFTIPQQRQ